jgi:hypothetical protein
MEAHGGTLPTDGNVLRASSEREITMQYSWKFDYYKFIVTDIFAASVV